MIIEALYLMVPAYAANMTPVIMRRFLPWLAKPVDCGLKLGKKRLFGDHKTWRGLIFGVIAGIVFAFIQYLLWVNGFLQSWAILDYSNWLIIGFLLSFGALLGDMMKSMVKRQFNFPEGRPFIPFDQIDFVIGGLALLSIHARLQWPIVVTAILLSFFLHILTNHLAFYSGIRKEKW